MIIDSLTHILPEPFRTEKERFLERDATYRALFSSPKARTASAEELLASMKVCRIDRSVVAGFGWTDIETAKLANDYQLEAAASSNGALIPLCSVNPLWGRAAVEEVERCVKEGARGVGELHADTQNFLDADLSTLDSFFSALREMKLPVLIHASEPVGHGYPGKGSVTPEYSLELARAFPNNRIVFAHFGGGLPFYSLMPEVRDELKNVYFDSSAFPFLYSPQVFDVCATAAGSDRVLFASDFPLISQERALAEFGESELGKAGDERVLGKNAQSVWLDG